MKTSFLKKFFSKGSEHMANLIIVTPHKLKLLPSTKEIRQIEVRMAFSNDRKRN